MTRRIATGLARLLLCLGVLLAAPRAGAALDESEVPEPLRPWIPWVLSTHPDARCPTLVGGDRRVCAWPARLSLDLGARGGSFAQEWRVHGRGFVPLPGGAGAWPEAVQVGERPAAVTEQGGRPAIWLEPGTFRVSGRFAWNALPQLLAVPPEVGLLELAIDGAAVTDERREPDGRLWLGAQGPGARPEAGEAVRVDIDVRRLVRDEIPLALVTRLDLDVAGPSRELRIAGAVLPRFVPTSLDSPLPARVESNGDLVVQVRPGRYAISLAARHEGPVSALELPGPAEAGVAPEAGAPLRDDEEVWAFEAQPALRMVEVSGGEAVDPQQTTLPPEWRGFPAFLMKPGVTLRFDERRRGDADPAPDALTLRRRLWLDFDGGGYTASDRIGGVLHRTWRLEASPALALGRVAVGGVDQPVTTLPGSDARGVEVREARLDVTADSRLDGMRRRIPAVGWSHDFQDVAATLELPPGWRLLFASGVDDAQPTWVGSWSLLDLFFVLVIALAIGRLLGRASGALALAALALTWLEPGAPQWPWAAVIAAEALVRALPDGSIRRGLRAVRLVLLLVLVVSVVGFLVAHLRMALYPTLEQPWARVGEESRAETADFAPAPEAGAPDFEAEMPAPAALPEPMATAPEERPGAAARMDEVATKMLRRRAPARYAPDPTIAVTTGPGLPEWQWRRVELTWRGPVRADQELSLLLLSPAVGFVLAWVRAGLAAALVLALLRAALVRRHDDATPGEGAGSLGAAALLALAALGTAPPVARADLPTPELLQQLEQRLLEAPPCATECASIGRLRVEATPDVLRLRLEASAEAETAIPLPGGAGHWLPEDVLLDGAPAQALRREGEGTLWIALSPGPHQIVLQGRTGTGDAIDLPLPMRPQRVESELSGFVLEGVRDDGRAEGALRLVREAAAKGDAMAPPPGVGPGARTPEAPALPAFFHVVRRLSLGLVWEVTTDLQRATPPGVAASLSVPLLPGESVTSESGRVENGRLLVNLGPTDSSLSWRSVLEPGATLALAAPSDVPWVETWIVDASPLWHVEASGLVPILSNDTGTRLRVYRPWPGESVQLALARPAGIAGATLTIDRSRLEISPGQRATDVGLDLVLRSSRGGQHAIALPDGSELLEATIDGRVQPLRLDGAKLVLPIEPRTQQVGVRWRESYGIRARLRTPAVDLGAPSVNAHLAVTMPPDRWTLFVSGPPIGPAVLFWSALAVLVPIAFGLARTRLTPLGVASWFLLGLGLTQVPVAASAVVAGWLLALGWRGRHAGALRDDAFRLTQIALVALSLAALGVLFFAIQRGLLGLPEMQIAGNGSSADRLAWYQDRAAGVLPQASVISAPLWVYRVAMLAWALWLAASLVGWLRWGWSQLGAGGYWRRFEWKRKAGEMVPPPPET